jgi:hypothetical protein
MRLTCSPEFPIWTDCRPHGGVHLESLDAPDDLPKQALCQVALGQLEHEGPGMSDQPPAGLEEPLLEARQGPALDGEGQDEPQQIAEVVGDDPQE